MSKADKYVIRILFYICDILAGNSKIIYQHQLRELSDGLKELEAE